jgi:predicted transcriptional regulator of viral defense system
MRNISVSKRDNEVIDKIRSSGLIVFTQLDVKRFLNISKFNTNKIINRMKRKDLIATVEKGKYILKNLYEELDIYEIVTDLYRPSYLSFWSALHYHHMTDQVPLSIMIATTRRKRRSSFMGQSLIFITIKKELFFGYERIGRTLVSDREKTIIDCLRHPEYSGGIDHVYNSIPEDLDADRIVEYCEMAGSTSIASRLGFLLERKGIGIDKERIRSKISTYSLLDPSGRRENPNSEWKLYENAVLR